MKRIVLTSTKVILSVMILVLFNTAKAQLSLNSKEEIKKSKTESIEDFETGDFSQFDWQTGGTQPWFVTDFDPYEGTYCASSGDINDNQTSNLSVNFDVYAADSITFWYNVSSESGFDYLRFYIDNVKLGEWSGLISWTRAAYWVTAGNHTFKWEYSKDVSISTGLDAAFIDYITFPPQQLEALFTVDTNVVCEQDVVLFYDQSIGPITQWNWTFEGGTPQTSTQQNPVVGYLSQGMYDVLLVVSDGIENAQIYMPNYIHVGHVPDAPNIPNGITFLCASWGNTTYNVTSLPGVTSYNWILNPDSAGMISGGSTNITVVWDPTYTGTAYLKVAGENYCGIGDYSDSLAITVYLPNVSLAPFNPVSISTAPFTLTGGSPAGGTYSGPGVSNGMFDPSAVGVGTYTITYTYTDPNACTNSADQDIVVTPVTGISQYAGDMNVKIIPNPNSGKFILKLYNDKPVNLTIYNGMNQSVYQEKNSSVSQDYTKVIDLSGSPEGIYYLHISGETINVVKKIIIH